MRTWRTLLGNERGVALVMSLMMLLALTGLLLAFISVSALEPQISRNVADTARARYLAEAGIEVGFNMLVNTAVFSTALAGANASNNFWAPLVSDATLSGVTTGGSTAEKMFAGTYSVTVRNDHQTSDSTITGQLAGSNAAPAETQTGDSNNIVIMRATGQVWDADNKAVATRTIEVVVRRAPVPQNFPGAVNLPGLQADSFINKTNFDIDGRDFSCSTSCDDPASWTAGSGMKYGIATQTGTQSNVGVFYEARVESNYVGSGFMDSSNTTIRGAFVANEKVPGEASGFFEFYLHGAADTFNIHYSDQMVNMVRLMRGNTALTNWREL